MGLDNSDIATLFDELVWLTKREGFIQRRLTLAPIVDEVLRGSLQDSFEKLRPRFTSAIYTLDDAEADLLLDIYGLTAETAIIPELMDRRIFHGEKIGRKVDTVRTREQAALKQLHSRLVTGQYAQAPLVLSVPEMHGGIIFEETSILIVIKDRKWESIYEHHRFANMYGELDYVTVGRSHPGKVIPLVGGDFKVNTKPVEGAGWNDHFWHLNKARTATEPMQPETRYDLKFKLIPPENELDPLPMNLGSRALHHRSLLLTIKVGFIGEVPKSIWKFTGASPFARPNTANEYNTVTLDEKQTVTLTLRDVHGGLFNGFNWEW